MNLIIKYVGFEPSEKLNEFAYDRLENLERYNKKIISVELTFKSMRGRGHDNKLCQLYISVPGKNLFVAKKSPEFEAALTDAIDALKKQIRMKKTRRLNRIRKQPKREINTQ